MAVRFQLRRDTAANWASVNPVLALGEPGVETDTLKVKVGDGATVWNSLAYSISNDFDDITNPPTTLAGYGIIDALSLVNLSVGAEAAAAGDGAIAYNNATGVFTYTPPDTSTFLTTVAYADLTSKPTTLSGYGITDAVASSTITTFGASIIDDADAAAVITTLGLGTAATTAATAYATSAQGTTADSAIQPNTSPTLTNATLTGYLAGPASFVIDPAAVGDDTGTVVIAGNLQVDGLQTTINSTTVSIDDLNFSIATDAADSAAANGAGITVGGAGATLNYTHTTTSWDMNKPLNVTGDIGVSGTVDGVDIAARDAILTSTTTTAGAALPKAGGTMTGNVGIGVTPNAGWSANNKVLDFGYHGSVSTDADGSKFGMNMAMNAYAVGGADPSSWKYKTNSAFHASLYHQTAGSHNFYVTNSTAVTDAAISWTTALTIDNAGNVGIGTADPAGQLHIMSGDAGTVTPSSQADDLVVEASTEGGITIMTPDDQSARIRFTSPSTESGDEGGADIFYRQNINKMSMGTVVSGGKLAFKSGASVETMVLDDGDVGIGTTPEVKLEVNGGADGSVVFAGRSDGGNGNNRRFNLIAYADGGGANYGGGLKIQTRDSANVFHDRITVQSNGDVGIGTTTPGSELSVVNTGDVKVEIKSTGTGDADAILMLDSADGGESEVRFKHDGVLGAKIQWFTDGGPDLNITTEAGTNGVIDFQPNASLAMRIDADGYVTKPKQPAFVAKFSATKSNTLNSPMLFDTVGYNIGNHYNGTTGIFTAPVAGRYQFNVMTLRQSGGSSYINLKVAINGASQDSIYGNVYTNDFTGEIGISGSWVVNLAANDQFAVWYGSSSTITFYATETAMSGILIG